MEQGAELQRWMQIVLMGRWFRDTNRRWLAGIVEALFAAALLLTGVTLLVINLTLSIIDRLPHDSPTYFVSYLLLSLVMIGLGAAWIFRLLWHVGVSAEYRGAIAAQTSELKIFQELRQPREDLPTVPLDRRPPTPGKTLPFRLAPSPRNVWGLVASGSFSIVSICLLTVLALVCAKSFGIGGSWVNQIEQISERITSKNLPELPKPWFGVGLMVALLPATVWLIYQFLRQLLKLAGIGPSLVEVSKYPLRPGERCDLYLSQTGRVRLQLLDVELICQENVTYNQGTDIRTETQVVFNQRLLRKRGVMLLAGQPFSETLELAIPETAMHSFSSPNNRIQWKIVITAKAKNWPRLKRTFTITVYPGADPAIETPGTRQLSQV